MNPISKFYSVVDNNNIDKINNVPEFPRIIELEMTNHCNFHCIMCKTGLAISDRGRGYMTMEIFDKLMAETKKYKDSLLIKFVGLGESLLNPIFIECIKKAKAQGHICHLTTNGSLMTEEIMEELIEAKFDSVKFSFQGVDHDGYAMMRRRDDFEELIDKISYFKKLRDSKESGLPFITIGTSITNESEELICSFREMCEEKVCDKLEIGMTNLEAIDASFITNEKIREDVLNIKNQQEMHKVRLPICNQVFDVITVRWNGDVSSCCADTDGLMKLGNILDTPIRELWMSPKQEAYRKILAERRYDDLPLCKNCYDFMGFMGSENKKGQ